MIVATFVHSFPGHSSTSPQVTLHFYAEMKYDTDISIHTFQNNLRTFIFQLYSCFFIYTHVIQNNLRTPQLAGFARQLGCKNGRKNTRVYKFVHFIFSNLT